MRRTMKNTFLNLLPFLLAGDLILPFLFALADRRYHHLTQVMSALGNPKAPLHILYNGWLLLGVGIFLGSFRLYPIIAEKSVSIAVMFVVVVCVYAVCGCILSCLFPVGESKELKTVSAKIHGYGSAVGFMLLTSAPLLLGLYFCKTADGSLAVFSFVCFALSLLFFILFIMADKPAYQGKIIAYEGLWQRLSLLCMYLPIIAFCIAENHFPV